MLAAVKVLVLGESGIQAWEDFYESAVVTFGEAWPAETAPVMQQVSHMLSNFFMCCGTCMYVNWQVAAVCDAQSNAKTKQRRICLHGIGWQQCITF